MHLTQIIKLAGEQFCSVESISVLHGLLKTLAGCKDTESRKLLERRKFSCIFFYFCV